MLFTLYMYYMLFFIVNEGWEYEDGWKLTNSQIIGFIPYLGVNVVFWYLMGILQIFFR